MSGNIYLAWAMPVDPIALTASLIAYASTKGALTTFQLCVRSAQKCSAPLSRLPPELLLSVEDYVLSSRRVEELERYK